MALGVLPGAPRAAADGQQGHGLPHIPPGRGRSDAGSACPPSSLTLTSLEAKGNAAKVGNSLVCLSGRLASRPDLSELFGEDGTQLGHEGISGLGGPGKII